MPGLEDDASKAWERGDYVQALDIYTALASADPWFLNSKACAELYLERYADALRSYELSQAFLRKGMSVRPGLAVATWLIGDSTAAIDLLETELTAIERRKTFYLDTTFGVGEGAILYYFGVSVGSSKVIGRARQYLEGLSAKPLFGESWPPGMLDYLLDKVTPAQPSVEIVEENEILRRRAFVKLEFCRGVKVHERDGRQAAAAVYAGVWNAPNPVFALDWFLARWEARRAN
jgi:hypothetical protein